MVKLNKERNTGDQIASILLLAIFGYILIRACIEFYEIAWGTGIWWGEFSLKWGAVFFVFIVFCVLSWIASGFVFWRQATLSGWRKRIVAFREKLGPFRWVVAIILLGFPVWFLQYTPWGIVFSGLYFRLLLWVYVALGLAIFLKFGKPLMSWLTILVSLLLSSSVFSIAYSLINVSDYPFSLGWSEGNRMWDYSMMFGRHLYDYPADQKVYVLIDIGRQFIGGFPFIFPGISIRVERLWVGLTTIIPYLLLGFAVFRTDFKDKKLWILLAFFTFIILKQGPIHPPLVICAFAVALVWRGALWFAIPLIFITGYFAEASRFTWVFAPGIWIVMLEFSGAILQNGQLQKTTWWRASVLGISGLVGGYYGPGLMNWVQLLYSSGEIVSWVSTGAVSISSIISSATVQPLLWYRLFPNATYGMGILLALLIATAPMSALLVYLFVTKKWKLNTLQKLTLVLPLFAFLIVGLIISTKIGGGGDLHNLDMFLIGLFFTTVIAWENGGRQWLSQIDASPVWIKGALLLLLVIPGIQPLSALRTFNNTENITQLVKLKDVSDKKFLDLLLPQERAEEILEVIRREVDLRKSQGEILFIDQRQLLTFGYIEDVAFVPEYEKKILMNEAMSASAGYFTQFYSDLESRRFSLIITEPLRAPVKDRNFQFGEENNAWVEWVVQPMQCYYEEIETFKSVQVQLLIPNQADVDCASKLPVTLILQD
ncbi:MAG: hypothetical protein QGD88_06295 [Anaerolineae bacterium]|nr:hypothetical protein [Anaerolineae bacterium]